MQNIFSHPLIVDDLSGNEKRFYIKTSESQREAIKDILKVSSVKSFEAEIKVKLSKKDSLLEVWGNIKASLELESVVSLELFNKKYNIDFYQSYNTKMTRKEQKALEEKQDNVPEIIINGQIDLADIIIEQIAINMDDYPRKNGEEFEFRPDFDESQPIKKSPFEVLAQLKK